MRARRLFLFGVAVALSGVFGGTAALARTQARRDGTDVSVTADRGGDGFGVKVVDGRIRFAAAGSEIAGVETLAVRRGDSSLDATVRGQRSTPGLVTIARAGLVETVQERPGGVEQSWRFQQAPGRSGDLVVSVAVPSLDYLATTIDGLTFRSATANVRYGNGTWVDAAGHRSPVPARYVNGHIELTVPADGLAGTTYPAVLDPVIVVTPIDTGG